MFVEDWEGWYIDNCRRKIILDVKYCSSKDAVTDRLRNHRPSLVLSGPSPDCYFSIVKGNYMLGLHSVGRFGHSVIRKTLDMLVMKQTFQ